MKKIYSITFIFILSIFLLVSSSLSINATTTNGTVIEDSNAELIEDEGNASVASSGEGYDHPDYHGEKWYILSKSEPTFGNQEVEIDYDEMPELLKYLKPGDIIYETNDSIVGDVTGHIAIVYDILWDEEHQQFYVSIIEAYTGGVGYSIMTPHRFDAKEVIIYRLKDASETQIQGALTWLEDKCGDSFKFHTRKYLNGLVEVDDEGNATTYWYCAELIWAAFMSPEDDAQRIKLDWDNNTDGGNLISPHALALSPHLTKILHYNKETVLTSVDDTYHTYSCDGDTYTEEHDYEVYNYCYEKCRACGYERQAKEHNYSYTTVSSSVHEATCTDCGYTETQWHTLQYTSTDSTYHSYICTDCGYTSSGEHKWGYQTINNTSHRKYCTSCGYIAGTESHVVDYTYTDPLGKYKQCKHCKGLYTSDIITPIIKNKIEIEEETE